MATIGWTTDTEADAYLAVSLGAATWASLSTDQKTAYLTTAYRILIANPEYSFPDTPSQKMKDAQAEYGLYLVSNSTGDSKRASLRAQGVREFEIGKFREKLDSNGSSSWSGVGMVLPSIVAGLLFEYLAAPNLHVFIERPLDILR